MKSKAVLATAVLVLGGAGNSAEIAATEGDIFKNPDFEQYSDWKRPANSKHPWNFKGGKAACWYFNENTIADAEIRNDGAASGKSYLRLKSPKGTLLFGQFVQGLENFPKGIGKCEVSLKVRGKCEVIVYISGKPSVDGSRMTVKVDSPDRWFEVKGVLSVPEKPNSLWIRINSAAGVDVDVDDFRFTPVAKTAKTSVPEVSE